MRKFAALCAAIAVAALSTGCTFKGKTDLGVVADEVGFKNITTGDGTFENYKAVSYESATELGFGLGIFTLKLMELYPAVTNEDLLKVAAEETKAKGANAMINVRPQSTVFIPFLFIAGIYVDSTAGTGVAYEH
jgi:hypothetical protein